MATEHFEERDIHGRNRLIIKKPRGRLTIEEIEDYMRGRYYLLNRVWALILCPKEDSYAGWNDETPKGDAAVLYEYEDTSPCPLCGETVSLGETEEEAAATDKKLRKMERGAPVSNAAGSGKLTTNKN
jgi:hypothetical protein